LQHQKLSTPIITMRLSALPLLTLLNGILGAHAKSCASASRVTPNLRRDFAIDLILSRGISIGIDVYGANQTHLAVTAGSFCANWNGGITGTVIVSSGFDRRSHPIPNVCIFSLRLISRLLSSCVSTKFWCRSGTPNTIKHSLAAQVTIKWPTAQARINSSSNIFSRHPISNQHTSSLGKQARRSNFVGRTNYVFEIGDSRYSAVNTGVYIGVETAYAANETGTYCKLGSYCRWNRKSSG